MKNLLYVLLSMLIGTVISVFILALALAILGWGNYGVFDGVIHYLKELPASLLWRNEANIVGDALVIPIFSTTLGFAGLGHFLYLADNKRDWLRGLFALMFFVAVLGFYSNYRYFDGRNWLYISGFVKPYIFALLAIIAVIVCFVYVKLDFTKDKFREILAIVVATALLSGIFELIQLAGFD